jgi:hypothetical protein
MNMCMSVLTNILCDLYAYMKISCSTQAQNTIHIMYVNMHVHTYICTFKYLTHTHTHDKILRRIEEHLLYRPVIFLQHIELIFRRHVERIYIYIYINVYVHINIHTHKNPASYRGTFTIQTCDLSSAHRTDIPVGMCSIRTAVSTLFTF